MKKIILNLNEAENEEQAQEYIARTFNFGPKYGKNLDALYDELTSISEPTAIGVFMPMGDMLEMDFDYMLYIDKLSETFAEAEEDNAALAVIFGDLPMNKGFEDVYDDIFDDDELDDYTGEHINSRGNKSMDNYEDDADTDTDDADMPGDHDVVLLDINQFRK